MKEGNIMINKEDIELLNNHFMNLEMIPEELKDLAKKINLLNEIQKANDELMKLMKESE